MTGPRYLLFEDNFSQLMLVDLPNSSIYRYIRKTGSCLHRKCNFVLFRGGYTHKTILFFFTVYDNAVVCIEGRYFVCLFHKRDSDWLIINGR